MFSDQYIICNENIFDNICYALRFRHRMCDITIMSILCKPFTLYQFVPCSYVFCVVVFKLQKS